MTMETTKKVGISELSRRKIYHRLTANRASGSWFDYPVCHPRTLLIDRVMTEAQAKQRGYRLCKKCEKNNEKERKARHGKN